MIDPKQNAAPQIGDFEIDVDEDFDIQDDFYIEGEELPPEPTDNLNAILAEYDL